MRIHSRFFAFGLALVIGVAACKTDQSGQGETESTAAAKEQPDESNSGSDSDRDSARDDEGEPTPGVVINPDAIAVDGEKVADLSNFEVPAEMKDGGESSLHIRPLEVHISESLDTGAALSTEAEPLPVKIPLDAPQRLFRKIVYSASMADAWFLSLPTNDFAGISASPLEFRARDIHRDEDSEALNLEIWASPDGYWVGNSVATMPPVKGCPDGGPTICTLGPHKGDVLELSRKLRRAAIDGRHAEVEALLKQIDRAYDLRELHALLGGIDSEYPEAKSVTVGGHGELPVVVFARLAQLVKADIPDEEFPSREAFRRELNVSPLGNGYFPDVVYGYVRSDYVALRERGEVEE